MGEDPVYTGSGGHKEDPKIKDPKKRKKLAHKLGGEARVGRIKHLKTGRSQGDILLDPDPTDTPKQRKTKKEKSKWELFSPSTWVPDPLDYVPKEALTSEKEAAQESRERQESSPGSFTPRGEKQRHKWASAPKHRNRIRAHAKKRRSAEAKRSKPYVGEPATAEWAKQTGLSTPSQTKKSMWDSFSSPDVVSSENSVLSKATKTRTHPASEPGKDYGVRVEGPIRKPVAHAREESRVKALKDWSKYYDLPDPAETAETAEAKKNAAIGARRKQSLISRQVRGKYDSPVPYTAKDKALLARAERKRKASSPAPPAITSPRPDTPIGPLQPQKKSMSLWDDFDLEKAKKDTKVIQTRESGDIPWTVDRAKPLGPGAWGKPKYERVKELASSPTKKQQREAFDLSSETGARTIAPKHSGKPGIKYGKPREVVAHENTRIREKLEAHEQKLPGGRQLGVWKPDQKEFFDRTKHEVVHRRKEELAEADPSDSKVAMQHEAGAGHKTVKRRKQEVQAVRIRRQRPKFSLSRRWWVLLLKRLLLKRLQKIRS